MSGGIFGGPDEDPPRRLTDAELAEALRLLAHDTPEPDARADMWRLLAYELQGMLDVDSELGHGYAVCLDELATHRKDVKSADGLRKTAAQVRVALKNTRDRLIEPFDQEEDAMRAENDLSRRHSAGG